MNTSNEPIADKRKRLAEVSAPRVDRWETFPRWVGRNLRRNLRALPDPYRSRYVPRTNYDVWDWIMNPRVDEGRDRPHWLDHWGMWRDPRTGSDVLVAEPYGLSDEGMRDLLAFAHQIGAHVEIGAASYHYPGSTVRIELRDSALAESKAAA